MAVAVDEARHDGAALSFILHSAVGKGAAGGCNGLDGVPDHVDVSWLAQRTSDDVQDADIGEDHACGDGFGAGDGRGAVEHHQQSRRAYGEEAEEHRQPNEDAAFPGRHGWAPGYLDVQSRNWPRKAGSKARSKSAFFIFAPQVFLAYQWKSFRASTQLLLRAMHSAAVLTAEMAPIF